MRHKTVNAKGLDECWACRTHIRAIKPRHTIIVDDKPVLICARCYLNAHEKDALLPQGGDR